MGTLNVVRKSVGWFGSYGCVIVRLQLLHWLSGGAITPFLIRTPDFQATRLWHWACCSPVAVYTFAWLHQLELSAVLNAFFVNITKHDMIQNWKAVFTQFASMPLTTWMDSQSHRNWLGHTTRRPNVLPFRQIMCPLIKTKSWTPPYKYRFPLYKKYSPSTKTVRCSEGRRH